MTRGESADWVLVELVMGVVVVEDARSSTFCARICRAEVITVS